MKKISAFLLTLCLLTSCATDTKEAFIPLDLMQHGIPLTIMAPDSADITSDDLAMMKDVTVKKGEDYYVQILGGATMASDPKVVKASQLVDVKEGPFFSKVLQDDENGFIYETKMDSTYTNYGFRYVRLQGDKEYIFQTGLIGTFTLDDVKRMYTAVQAK